MYVCIYVFLCLCISVYDGIVIGFKCKFGPIFLLATNLSPEGPGGNVWKTWPNFFILEMAEIPK